MKKFLKCFPIVLIVLSLISCAKTNPPDLYPSEAPIEPSGETNNEYLLQLGDVIDIKLFYPLIRWASYHQENLHFCREVLRDFMHAKDKRILLRYFFPLLKYTIGLMIFIFLKSIEHWAR